MTVKTSIALGALTSLALASTAFAQAPAAPAAPASGPAIAGVCVYSGDRALSTSLVGKAVNDRLLQLQGVVNAELQNDAAPIAAEQKALEGLTREQAQQPANVQRIQAFQQRVGAFRQKQELRNQELEATQRKQIIAIGQAIDPILTQVYTERGCSLLLNHAGVIFGNPAMDVTDLVVQRLNQKLTTISFEREHLEQQAAAAAPFAPPAARPAAPATTPKKKK